MLSVKTEPESLPAENIVDVDISDQNDDDKEDNCNKMPEVVDVDLRELCAKENFLRTKPEKMRNVSIQTDFLTILGKERLLYHCPHCPALFAVLKDLNDHMAFKGETWLMENHIRDPNAPRPVLPPNVIVSHTPRKRALENEPVVKCESPKVPNATNEDAVESAAEIKPYKEETCNSILSNQDNSNDASEQQQDGASVRKRRRKKKDPSYEPPLVVKVPPVRRTQGLRTAKRKTPIIKDTSSSSSESTESGEEESDDSDEPEQNAKEESHKKSQIDVKPQEIAKKYVTIIPKETTKQLITVKNLPVESPPQISVKVLPLEKEAFSAEVSGKSQEEACLRKKKTGEKRVMESLQKNHLMRIGLIVEGRSSNLRFPEKVHPAISRLRHRVLSKENKQNLKAIETVEKLHSKVQAMKDKELNASNVYFRQMVPTTQPVRVERPLFVKKVAPNGPVPSYSNKTRKQGPIVIRAVSKAPPTNEWMPKIVSSSTESTPVVLRAIPQGMSSNEWLATNSSPNGPIILAPVSSAGTTSSEWMPQIVTSSGGKIIYRAIPTQSGVGSIQTNPAQNTPLILTQVSPSPSGQWMPRLLETSSANVVMRKVPQATPTVQNSQIATAEWAPQVTQARSLDSAATEEAIVPSMNIDLSILSNCN